MKLADVPFDMNTIGGLTHRGAYVWKGGVKYIVQIITSPAGKNEAGEDLVADTIRIYRAAAPGQLTSSHSNQTLASSFELSVWLLDAQHAEPIMKARHHDLINTRGVTP